MWYWGNIMSELLNLAIYNPAHLKDEDFLKCFVARHDLADRILARLGEIKPRSSTRHGLIIGQRGMGKTSMLRRIALGVRETPELAAVLLPLSFREEQYNIHNLHVFWCNCLDALGDFYDATGQHEQTDKLDREVSALNGRADDEEGSNALGVFRSWMKREEKRPLLLLDNIDLIFDGLKDKQWSLRRILQEAGGVIVIGASSGFPEATSKSEAAFYDFFKVDVLEKLSHEEIFSCLHQLAIERGEPGQKVIRILESDPARIHALYDLTGGNPRTLSILYLMLEVSEDGNIMRDLERLLDQSTPLYKAKVEEFAIQARVVFDAIALAWNPITAAEVATITGLEVGAVSAQLDRLVKNGVLEKTSLSSTRRIGFMLAERFFNIWYLMRHAPRRQRNRLRWLVEFLRKFYTPLQLADHAAKLIKNAAIDDLTHGAYCLAMSKVVEDGGLKNVLRHEAKQDMKRYALERGEPLENLANPDEFFTPASSTEWFEHGQVLHKIIRDYKKAEAAYRMAIELNPESAVPWNQLGNLLQFRLARYVEAEVAYRKGIELDPKFDSCWGNLGHLLEAHFGRYQEALDAGQRAVGLDAKNQGSWCHLGYLLLNFLNRTEDAKTAYEKALSLAPDDMVVKTNLLVLQLITNSPVPEIEFETNIALHPPYGAALLRSIKAVTQENFGEAVVHFNIALTENVSVVLKSYRGIAVLILRQFAARGYGEKLLAWLNGQVVKLQ